jgi:hypothetical protein
MMRQRTWSRPGLLVIVTALTTAFAMVAPGGAADTKPDDAALTRIGTPPEDLKLDPFYKKYVDANGIPVIGSEKVSDHALREAAHLIGRMLEHRPDVLAAMVKNKVRFVVIAYSERTTDVPEQRGMTPKDFWDVRARGLGASRSKPIVSCGEENLLDYPGDPYKGENILIHEFGHAIHGLGLRDVDPTFERRLRQTYDDAIRKGLWRGTYAASNPAEYWAEVVQSWFDCNLAPPDFQHIQIDCREKLKAYDPVAAALAAVVFGDGPWRYVPPDRRPEQDNRHLAGYDPAQAPTFSWGPAQKKYDEVLAEKRRLRLRDQERQAAQRKTDDPR